MHRQARRAAGFTIIVVSMRTVSPSSTRRQPMRFATWWLTPLNQALQRTARRTGSKPSVPATAPQHQKAQVALTGQTCTNILEGWISTIFSISERPGRLENDHVVDAVRNSGRNAPRSTSITLASLLRSNRTPLPRQ